jgi:dGTPase
VRERDEWQFSMQDLSFAPRRAPYAADAGQSRGRRFFEPPSPTRSEFQRDRDRIIHSTAFRRLAHKTQVFVPHEGDHYRTRLTHSMEVGQIARALARSLGLDDDLAEALALGHDLGHTPFGHSGEEVLDELMVDFGGFDHNAQALRIVTKLERRYADFDGLNLSWETLEGLVKHNGPLLQKDGTPIGRYAQRGLPIAVKEYNAQNDLELATFASAEAQAAALADDIAYNAHDIDDGLRAGLFDLAALDGVDFLGDLTIEIKKRYPTLTKVRFVHELGRRVITLFIEDAIRESRARLAQADTIGAVRHASRPLIAFSPVMIAADRAIKSFLFENMYRHAQIVRVRIAAAGVVRDLFVTFHEDPAQLPPEWAQAAAAIAPAEEGKRARLVCDYIAGMTDRYALAEHARLFDVTPDLR